MGPPQKDEDVVEEAVREKMERQQREFEQKMAAERAKMEAELAAAQRAQREAEEKARMLNNILDEERRKTAPPLPPRPQVQASALNLESPDHAVPPPIAGNGNGAPVPEGGDDVHVDLILKTDFSETVGRGEEYKSGIAADMAAAVGCNPHKIRVKVSVLRSKL